MMKCFFAPGRVNLIGEHLDYNGGLVLPAAINLGITARYCPDESDTLQLRSAGHEPERLVDLTGAITYENDLGWTNYPAGVIRQLLKEGHRIRGGFLDFESTIPEQSGLSSSAALEVLTAFTLLNETEAAVNRVWLANLCRQTENEFIGVPCGIMDQYAVAMGRKDHALLIDCTSLEHTAIPFETGIYRLMVMNTNKPRALIHSRYKERKEECDEALRIIQQSYPIHHLCEADMRHLALLKEDIIYKRARHVISEHMRVKEAVKALVDNDLSTLGRLMNASHRSLKEDYEVTGTELDLLAETAQRMKGCLGARMTGAGFGGCAIALVRADAAGEFSEKIQNSYAAATGRNCSVYNCTVAEGVHQIT